MSDYRAPVKDMLFVLRELAGLEAVSQLPGYEEATDDLVEAILEEAAGFAAGVVAPINTIGDSELITVWKDPDFYPFLKAFYYARVIEIPTPRWVLYDKLRLGAEIPERAEVITQERAYTSPIWYTP